MSTPGRGARETDAAAFLSWALLRALDMHVDAGDTDGAMDSMMSDLWKFEGDRGDLADHDPQQFLELLGQGRAAVEQRMRELELPLPDHPRKE
jgi:hypothetical protein